MVWSTSQYALTNLSQFMSGSKLSGIIALYFRQAAMCCCTYLCGGGRHSNCKDS